MRDPWGLLYYCNDRNEAFSMWRIEQKFYEQFSNQIRQITKGFKNAAGTLGGPKVFGSLEIA